MRSQRWGLDLLGLASFFNWSLGDLYCCASFSQCTAKYTYSFQVPFHYSYYKTWDISNSTLCGLLTVLVAQSCPTLCNPMGCSPPDSSVHGVLQARILEWVAIPFSRRSSQSRDWTWVSCIAGHQRRVLHSRSLLFIYFLYQSFQFSCLVVSNSVTPWTAALQASLSIANSQSLLKLMSIELFMPFNHLILCGPLLLLPSIYFLYSSVYMVISNS